MFNEVIKFWFEETSPKQWFEKNPDFDLVIENRFKNLFYEVVAGEHADWRSDPEGRLAEIIVLDQFTRNMFRDEPESFKYDFLALALAQEAVRSGDDQKLEPQKRTFLYMPFMHSESKEIHKKALELFTNLGQETNLEYEIKHKEIIDKFGRYPHRNKILGRESTPEEIEFLKTNSGF